ncbi:MAG TPA: RHS repeat-associated core domain-containing protein [Pyrinomonadaceae bacterium]|nr:RHS repeat-associated core domain-containing protein [Pyrinomonadaceae bacterium]
MKTANSLKRRINCGLALFLSAILASTPVLTFAAGSNRSRFVSLPKRVKPDFIPKPVVPNRAARIAMQIQPEGQSATLLPDGRILLIGGDGSAGPQSAVSIKDPRTQEITLLPNGLYQARAWHSATMLPDGRVLVVGGVGLDNKVISSAEIYDPQTTISEPLPLSRLSARAYHTATLLTTGQVLIVGGSSDNEHALTRAELFDPKTRAAVTLPARLSSARQKHKATLLADGNVLLEGGTGGNSDRLTGAELFNPETRSFIATSLSSDQIDGNAPYVAASLPADGATDVPVDTRIAIRFSKALRVESVNAETVRLTSSDGSTVATRIVPAENGRLAFLTASESLLPGTSYTVTLTSATDGTSVLTPTTISFTTAGDRNTEPEPSGDADWVPGADNFRGDWRSRGRDTSADGPPALLALPGETALSGRVLTLLGKPLADVTISVDGHSVKTDDTGRFLLASSLTAGHRVMLIDGRTASKAGRVYGIFRVGVDITSAKTNVLPYTIWMPRLDTAHAARLSAPTTADASVSTPMIPGLELRLPAGTVIRDLDGRTVTEITITPIPTDRPPFPLPRSVHVPVFFTIQPGGAQVIPPRARLIYPNFTNQRPGTRIDFWNYDPTEKGWYIYGQGTVSPDAKQIVPDPGVVIYEFSGAMVSSPSNAPPNGPPAGSGPKDKDGEPVDLSTGLFVYERTDLVLPDTIPISLTRTYRQSDTVSRPFGIGMTHPYEIFMIGDTRPYTFQELILPDGARIHYDRISPGTSFSDAVYEHTASQTGFYKSQLAWNGNGWNLTLKDGSVYTFPDSDSATVPRRAACTSMRNRFGETLTLTRDSNSNLTRITTPNGRWVEFTYDTSNRITLAKDNIGRTVGYTYDAGGRLWKMTDPAGGVTEYTYDGTHQMLTIKDARSNVYLTNEYDANGRVFRQTQADGGIYLFAYTLNGSGKVTQTDVTDPLGNIRRTTFNSAGYVFTDTFALGKPEQQVITYERQAGTNFLLSVTDPLGRKTAYTYDTAGNPTSTTWMADTAEAVSTGYTFDPVFGKPTTITDPLNKVTHFDYDAKGNLTSQTDPLGHGSSYIYNNAGQPTSMTDALTHSIQWNYDAGDLTSATDPLGRTITQFVDAAGRLLSSVDAAGKTVRYEYDVLNQVTKLTDPTGNITQSSYDANSNLLSVTDTRGKVTSYVYDNMDRVVTRTDPLQHDETLEYDLGGNLVKVTDRRGKVTTFGYDALHRIVFIGYGTVGSGPSATYESTITNNYDAAGHLASTVDSVAGTITLTYDNLDRLTSEITPQGTVTYGYDAAGRQTSMTVTGQTAVTYTYDDAGRLTQITQGTATATIAYDNANRRTSLTLSNGVAINYDYDAASQLTSLTYLRNSTTLGTLTYAYDNAGHRIKVGGSYARTSLPAAEAGKVYNDNNQITQRGAATLSYDLNGNLTSDGVNTYTWNARNQLASISGPGLSASFEYDAFGRRISKTLNGNTSSFLYNGGAVVQEIVSGTPVATMLTGAANELLTRTDAAGTSSYLPDGLCSTLALIDSAGVLQTQYTYDPFGNTTASGATTNRNAYTGREDDGTGLYYLRNRYYSPGLQRFISEDPIEFAGGDANLYAYVLNNPILYTDPNGLNGGAPSSGPYLPNPDRKPPGWNPSWPTGEDGRGPYTQDPNSGRKYYPHPEDGRHWDHYDYDDDKGKPKRYPPDSIKPRPGQKKPKPGQCDKDPWPKPQPQPAPDPAKDPMKYVPEIPPIQIPEIPPWVIPVGIGLGILFCIACPECCMILIPAAVKAEEQKIPADVPRRIREQKKRTGHTDVSGR